MTANSREDTSFVSGGMRCAAWLYRPEGPGPHPVVVMAHGIGAVRQVRLPAYAEHFAASGIAVLCFDYRRWGESEGAPRCVLVISEQHADLHAALDFAKTLPGIDPRRVALWGTSFGGGHALVVAGQRADLSAVVAQCAVTDCLAVSLGTPLRQIALWMAAALHDLVRVVRRRAPIYVPLASEPGTAGVMTKAGAEASYRAMLMEPSRWENKVAARMFLTLPLYRPVSWASRIAAPLLMIVTDNDEICSGTRQSEAAAKASKGIARHYPAAHFEIYFGELFERAVAEMTLFLVEQLGVAPAATPETAKVLA